MTRYTPAFAALALIASPAARAQDEAVPAPVPAPASDSAQVKRIDL